MNKRGQFFLIGALVLIAIILSLTTVYTNTRARQEDNTLSFLAQQIQEETLQVIDYAMVNDQNLTLHVGELAAYYAQANPDKDVLVVYGTSEGVMMEAYARGIPSSMGVISHAPPDTQARLSFNGVFSTNINLSQAYTAHVLLRSQHGDEQTVIFQ